MISNLVLPEQIKSENKKKELLTILLCLINISFKLPPIFDVEANRKSLAGRIMLLLDERDWMGGRG